MLNVHGVSFMVMNVRSEIRSTSAEELNTAPMRTGEKKNNQPMNTAFITILQF